MVEPIRIKDQFSLISGTKSIQDDTNIVADVDDDCGADSDIADPDGDDDENPDDPEAFGDYEVCAERKNMCYCTIILSILRLMNKMGSVSVSILSGILNQTLQ